MVAYSKRVQSGTDRDGNPTFTVTQGSYKKSNSRSSKKRASVRARRKTDLEILKKKKKK